MTISEHSNRRLLTIDLIPAGQLTRDDPKGQRGYITFKMEWQGKQYGTATPLTREDCEGDKLCEAFDVMLEHVRRTFDALQASTPEQRAEWDNLADDHLRTIGAVQ